MTPPRSPSYLAVFLTFARNSLVRDMMFRTNFLLQCITSVAWTSMNLGFFALVFGHTRAIGIDSGWGRDEFFVFLGTTWIINSLVQAFLMPNADDFSELIRTGNLDFALLKPIDTQFVVSFQKVEWSSLSNLLLGICVVVYSMARLAARADKPVELHPVTLLLYPFYILCGVSIMYSIMIGLASTSIWLGRNQSLYDFWFYITNFSRYPMEIYRRGWGVGLFWAFTLVVPVLVVVNVPARILAQPLHPRAWWEWPLAGFTLAASGISLVLSRWVFQRALTSYRSASS